MIISHEHRFIFLKTRKTASTSIEIALSEFCGPQDVITPISKDDEDIRHRLGFIGPRNYRKPLLQRRRGDWLYMLLYRDLDAIPALRFYNHITAAEVRALVPPEVWESYFKFSIERNPWDKALSYYHWDRRSPTRKDQTLPDFLYRLGTGLSNWPVYASDGNISADFVVRYEHLAADLAEVGKRIGLPKGLSIENIHAKSGARTDRKPYQEVLTEAERGFIYHLCRREIEHFGYQF